MKRTATKTLAIITIPVVAIAMSFLALSQLASDVSLSDWYQNDTGYRQAMAEQSVNTKPIILFFHTQWCTSCKALKENVLVAASTKEILENFISVAIDPEINSRTQAIARQYNVLGFPTIVVISAQAAATRYYYPKRGVAPEQFATAIQKLAIL